MPTPGGIVSGEKLLRGGSIRFSRRSIWRSLGVRLGRGCRFHLRLGSVALFHKLILYDRFAPFSPALEAGISHGCDVKLDRSNSVIVARDDIIDAVRITVGVDDTDNRDAEFVGFCNRDTLMIHVDHEQGIG